jgi:hypothetical protein
MSQATPSLDFTLPVRPEPQQVSNFATMVQKNWRNLTNVVNGNIGYGDGTNSDNINGRWISVTSPSTPNTDFVVDHNLERIPVGYHVMMKSASCDVYTGSTAPTSSQLTLRATVGSVALSIFVV